MTIGAEAYPFAFSNHHTHIPMIKHIMLGLTLVVGAVNLFVLGQDSNQVLKQNTMNDEGNSMFKHKPGRFQSLKMPCKLLSGVTERDYGIYLPGNYEEDSLCQYPVLYLMHGGGGSHNDWERLNHISQVADSLINSGVIEKMIIVCPEGNQQHMMYFDASTDTPGAPEWKYETYFFQELIPYIERNYRVRTDKGGRAIGGFSMGGGAATVYGVHHPEMFSMVYDISGYQRAQQLDFLNNDPSASWRHCGS